MAPRVSAISFLASRCCWIFHSGPLNTLQSSSVSSRFTKRHRGTESPRCFSNESDAFLKRRWRFKTTRPPPVVLTTQPGRAHESRALGRDVLACASAPIIKSSIRGGVGGWSAVQLPEPPHATDSLCLSCHHIERVLPPPPRLLRARDARKRWRLTWCAVTVPRWCYGKENANQWIFHGPRLFLKYEMTYFLLSFFFLLSILLLRKPQTRLL